MIIKYLPDGNSIHSIQTVIQSFELNPQIKSILLLACDQNGPIPETIDPLLRGSKLSIFGAVFPQIIYQNKNYKEGILIVGIEQETNISIVQNLSDSNLVFEDELEQTSFEDDCKTVFVFVDAFATRIEAFIEGFFNVFGLEFNVVGAGAGSMSMTQKPCIFTNDGLIQDAVLIAGINVDSGVGVKHGWNDLSGPFKATSSKKSTIFTLGEETAFAQYKKVIEQDIDVTLTQENFFEYANAYPFGISRLGIEKIVRDPFRVNADESLFFLGDIPQGVYLHILKGEKESLLKAAAEAYIQADNNLNSVNENKSILFIDCISRYLFLNDDYVEELNAVNRENTPMIGALTLGEIANNKKEYLEFYNKTAVVSIIEDL